MPARHINDHIKRLILELAIDTISHKPTKSFFTGVEIAINIVHDMLKAGRDRK